MVDNAFWNETLHTLIKLHTLNVKPISIVEDRGFNAFVKTLDPSYKIPNRKRLMEDTIADMYKDCQDKVRANCQRAHSVVLTTDMRTSRSTEAYLTVSCHFIDNWQMQEFVLETCSFCGQHTADNISLELKRITDEWGIAQKVVAVVTDNGANMVSAVHKAGWKHYPCFAHTLNMVVKDGIKAVPEVVQLLEKCKLGLRFRGQVFEQLFERSNSKEHKLIQSVETRWNSVFYMLERLHEQREAVTTALCLLGKNTLCLSNEELSMIHLTIEALRPFEEATREVSAEKHVSVSKVIPLVSLLLRAAAATERQGSSLDTELALQCQRRFRGIETFHSLAASTFLDIRFKNLAFSTAKGGIWADFDIQVLSAQQHRSTGTDALIEMSRYLEEKLIPRYQDPLHWWQEHEQTFPSLSRLAAKYLGFIASSVPSERIFSKAGELVSQRRNRLKGGKCQHAVVSKQKPIHGERIKVEVDIYFMQPTFQVLTSSASCLVL
ncbi:ZBED4 protein, partial [Polyodon spathula]|nr:ZBED4 protein [Polyodon spathula]